MPVAPRLSVVIPTLDEAGSLPALLDDLAAQTLATEIVVADGGSRDTTCAEAARRGLRLVRAARGRALQMNAGAESSCGELLLFLHADSRLARRDLLQNALSAFAYERAQGGTLVAGHFALRFERSQPGADALFRFMEAKTRSGRRGTVNGDQGLLIARADFEALGRFDARLPFLEDQRIAEKIFRAGRWVLLPGELRTSARRFEAEGHRRRYALMALMMAMHEAGIEAFFELAPQLYAEQARAEPLRLGPFFALARRLFLEQLRREPASFLKAGRYLCGNAWQLALMADLALSPEGEVGPWLGRYDRRIAPLMKNPVADALAACMATGLVLGLAPGLERLARRGSPRLRKQRGP